MAISKRGSHKIIVTNTEFRWRATGNDGWISVVIWPANRDFVKLAGEFEYHSEYEKESDDSGRYKRIKGQIIITNRVIKKIIEYVTVEKILNFNGEINLGRLEDIYDIEDAIREPVDNNR